MAGYKKFDPKLEWLVMETRTEWAPEVGELSDEDRRWLAHEIHRHPQLASNIRYERTHTGFARVITVTVEDIERLYRTKVGG